jgi:hypothetical protein
MYRVAFAGWYDETHLRIQPTQKTRPAQFMKKVTFQNL